MSLSRSRSRSRQPGAQSSVPPRTPFNSNDWWDVTVTTAVTGVEHQIAARCMWPLKTFKAEICTKTGVPAYEQHLVFDGNILSQGDKTLWSHGLHQHAEVTLVRSTLFKLPVKFLRHGNVREEETLTIDVEASDTIEAVKAKIQEKKQKEIPKVFGMIDLELFELEVGRTLSDYNIHNENGEIWIFIPNL